MGHSEDHEISVSLPDWVRRPFVQCFDRLEDEARYLHLTMRGLAQLTKLPSMIELLQKINHHEEDEKTDKVTYDLDREKSDAKWVENEIKGGFKLLHSHSAVSIWSTVEVLAEDIVVRWIENRRDVWKIVEVQKLKLSVGMYESLTEIERARLVAKELARAISADVKLGIGKLEGLLNIFGLCPQVGTNLRNALHELYQVRNVLVHNGAKADQRLILSCPWLKLQKGERINIDHYLWSWYFHAANMFAERVLNQMLIVFGNKGCECPGMDDIQPRPTESSIVERSLASSTESGQETR